MPSKQLSENPDRKKFEGIQIARAAAALLVVIWHAGGVSGNFRDVDIVPPAWLQFGDGGVDLFFVISGFIIMHVTRSPHFDARDFLMKRFLRIYPLYAFFSALVLFAFLINPAWKLGVETPTPDIIAKSFLVLPQQPFPILFVGWSLEHEAIFYLIVAAVFAAGWRQVLLPFLLTLFLAGVLLRIAFGDFWDDHLLSPFHIQFAIGVLAYHHRHRLAPFKCLVPVAAGLAIYALTAWLTKGSVIRNAWPDSPAFPLLLTRTVGFGIGAGLMLVGSVNMNVARLRDSRFWAPAMALLIALGDASYGLYLSHPFVMSLAGKLGVALRVSGSTAVVLLVLAVAAAALVALIFYRLVEKPYLNWVHRRITPRKGSGEAISVPGA